MRTKSGQGGSAEGDQQNQAFDGTLEGVLDVRGAVRAVRVHGQTFEYRKSQV